MARLNRTIHLYFHTMPDILDMGKGFDAEVFVYYPTKVGIMHMQCLNWINNVKITRFDG